MQQEGKKIKLGFTLIELLVVVLIIGILVTLSTVIFGRVRIGGRDARRISDIAQIQRALEMYKNDNSIYPTGANFVVGQPLVSLDGSTTYLAKIPANPLPDDGSGCSVAEYTYTQTESGVSYRVQFCLGAEVAGAGPNNVEAVPNELVDIADAPAAVCGNNILEGSEVCEYLVSSGNCTYANFTYYPLQFENGTCVGQAACSPDCTACALDCNGSE